jgi:ankyrin repeat protein
VHRCIRSEARRVLQQPLLYPSANQQAANATRAAACIRTAHIRLEALLADESLDVRVISFSAHALLASGAVVTTPAETSTTAGAARRLKARKVTAAAAQPQLQLLHSAAALGLTAIACDAPQQVLNGQWHGNPELVTAVVTAATAAAAAAAAMDSTAGSSSGKAKARKAGAARRASARSYSYGNCDDGSDYFDEFHTPGIRRSAARLPASPLYTALPWPANVRALLALGFSAAADVGNRCGDTPLHWAAAGGQVLSAQCLLEAGATVDAEDCSGRTPLAHAAAAGHPSVCAVLLQAGAVCTADSFAVHGKLSPLWLAAVRKLSCEDEDEQALYTTVTTAATAAATAAAARAAACDTSAECLAVLAQGSSTALHSRNAQCGSLLHGAASAGNVLAVAYLLLQYGSATTAAAAALHTAIDSEGHTALHKAAAADSAGAVRLLLEAEWRVTLPNSSSSTSSSSSSSAAAALRASVLGQCIRPDSSTVCFELLLDAAVRSAHSSEMKASLW